MHVDDLCLCLGNGVVSQLTSFVLLQVEHSAKCLKGVIDVSGHIHAYIADALAIMIVRLLSKLL